MALTRYGVGSATGSGANIPDAPVDGVLYGRKDGDWSQAVEPAELAAHLADTTDAHDASAISILDVAGDYTATDVEGALAELQTVAVDGLANHLTDTVAAHSASAIYYFGSTNLAADNVEAALDELDGDHTAHLDDTVGAHAASAISIVDTVGGYAGANVEAALDEVADRIGDGAASIGFRNRIINGDMRIDQRNAGAAIASGWSVDRWNLDFAGAGTQTLQRLTTGTPPAGFSHYLRYTVTGADASIAATDVYCFGQKIEGLTVGDLGFGGANAKTITVSFWCRSSLTGTFSGSICNQAGATTRGYAFTFTISSANTWEYKTVTITGDTGGTWPVDSTAWGSLRFCTGAGSDWLVTAGSWTTATTQVIGATGTTQLISTLNATFDLTGVQLEVGSVATPYERRPYGTELALCKRYYERFTVSSSAYLCQMHAYSTVACVGSVRFEVEKRVVPTASDISAASTWDATAANFAVINATSCAVTLAQCTTFLGRVDLGVASGLVIGDSSYMLARSGQTATVGFSAEL